MRSFLAAVLSALFFSVTAFADPVGRYDVQGNDPGGGSPYTGTVTVEKTGETYRVVWIIDGERYLGTAVGNKDFLAISYRSKDQTGLALYGAEGGGWKGVWTYSGGRQLGAEAWTRR